MLARVARSARLFAAARRQARIPFATEAEWGALQARRVRQMVAHAFASVPFYRSFMLREGLRPEHFRSAADLRAFPLVSKAEVARAPGDFLSTRQRRDRCLELRTSGTTGRPGSFWHDPGSMLANLVYGERERRVLPPRTPGPWGCEELVFRHPGSPYRRIQEYYDQRVIRPRWARSALRIASTADPIERNIDLLNERRPRLLSAHGSYLGALYRHAHRSGKEIHRPQVAVYCADAPSERDQNLIEEGYGVRLLSVYRSAESLKIGFTCGEGSGFHLHPDLCAVHLADPQGRPVPDGDAGEVVISNLLNRATVLLNYRLGDIAVLDRGTCRCGRTFPRLRSLDGRGDELITLPDGDALDPSRIKALFQRRGGVEIYQVVQRDPRSFHVRVQPIPGAPRGRLEETLKAELSRILGEGATIRVELVDDFPTDGQTKFRVVVPWSGGALPGPLP